MFGNKHSFFGTEDSTEANTVEQTNAIELKNITKTFGAVAANDRVSLTLRKGEILSVLGEN